MKIVVTENPQSTINTSTQPLRILSSDPFSDVWSGYELYPGDGSRVYYASGDWNEPSVSPPWTNACEFDHCDIAVAIGLTNSPSGSTGFVFGGSDSGIYCTIGCSYHYYLWYEAYPASSSITKCLNVNPTDSLGVFVEDAYLFNGGSVTSYVISLSDVSSGYVCKLNGNYQMKVDNPLMGLPNYAAFLLTRLQFSTGTSRLPKFAPVPFTASNMYYDNGYYSIYTPYQNNWYIQYTMNNGCGTNINVSPIYPSDPAHGYFESTWLTSCGT